MIQRRPTIISVSVTGRNQAGLPPLAFLALTESGTAGLAGRFSNLIDFFSFSDMGQF